MDHKICCNHGSEGLDSFQLHEIDVEGLNTRLRNVLFVSNIASSQATVPKSVNA